MIRVLNEVAVALSSSQAIWILAKATIVLALTLFIVWLARNSRAAVRHALLASSFSILLVLPFASFLATPRAIALPVAGNDAIVPFFADTPTTSSLAPVATHSTPSPTRPARPVPPLSTILIGAWLFGCAAFVFPIVSGLLQIRSLRRFGLPWRHGQNLANQLAPGTRRVEVLLHESLSGPVTCGVLQPGIVLPSDAQTWNPDDLERAIIHELEHVRRYDWATHCMARLACAVYWFHPLVWIARKRLALEAERSCDDAVLGNSEPTAYADQLVALAKRISKTQRSSALAMANRSDLSARVGALLDARQRRGPVGALLITATCTIAALIVVTMSPLRMVAAPQSAPSASPQDIPKWAAVSVKACASEAAGPKPGGNTSTDRIALRCQNLVNLVFGAYTVYQGGRYNGTVAGAVRYDGFPSWTRTEQFSIEAKAEGNPGQPMMRGPMLQKILEDRFHLRVHAETKEGPVYILSVAKGGPKMPPLEPGSCEPLDLAVLAANSDPSHDCPRAATPGPIRTWDVWTNMDSLARFLTVVFADPAVADTPVINRTELTGAYHVHLQFAQQPQATALQTPQDPAGPSIFTAVQQLGLKLESGKGLRQYLIFDSADRPTEN